MADFVCPRWRQSAILDWFYACWDHPRRVFGGLCDCATFGCNRCSNFDSMQISIFCTLSMKMPIQAPKIGVLGDFTPKMGSSMNETPKRHILGRKHVVYMTYRSSKSVHFCVHLRNHNTCFFTCSPRPPTLSQRHMDLNVLAYPRPGYIFQVSSKSVQGFRNPRGSKFGLSHYFGQSLLQQLVLPYRP